MIKIVSTFLFLLASNFLISQSNQLFSHFYYINQADSLMRLSQFQASATSYSTAFKSKYWQNFKDYYPEDANMYQYNAALVWTLAKNYDSSFLYLTNLVENDDFSEHAMVSESEFLLPLHSDQRWAPLLTKMLQNKSAKEAKLNFPLMSQLESVLIDDQKYRGQLKEISENFGYNSKEVDNQWKIIKEKDSFNLRIVDSIIEKFGWLGTDVIGAEGNQTLFLVIQHSNLKVQEKYLPIFREAVKNKKALPEDLALLEDRILMYKGKKQIYGSQIQNHPTPNENVFFVYPLEDPDNVDLRRANVGLFPIADYVSNWNIKWDIEQYKKDLPLLEEIVKSR